MKHRARFVVPMVVLLLSAAPAFAQNQWRFEVFGAGTFPFEKEFEVTSPQSSTPLKGRHEFSPGGGGGIRFGTDGRGHWGQDLVYSYGSNPTRIVIPPNGLDFSFNYRTHQLSYNALWYPGGLGNPKAKVFPFLSAGVGGTIYTISQFKLNVASDPNRANLGKLKSDNIFAFNAGAGVRFRINSLYGLRFDIRDYMTRPARFGLPLSSNDPNATVFPVSGLFHQLEVSFAFVYYFK